MRSHRRMRAWGGFAAALLVLSLAAAGCGDDNETVSEPTPSASGASLLGPEKKATGAVLKIGFITEGRGTTVDNTEELLAAQATVKYINNHLGGVAGRPIELVVCQVKSTLALAKDCASQMVRAKLPVVVTGVHGLIDQVIDVLSPAKLPYFIGQASTAKALGSPNVYVMTNGLATLAGAPAAYAKENGFKKVMVIVIDVPAASGPVTQLGGLVYGNAGATIDPVLIAPGTADHTPAIQAGLRKNPDMIQIIGDPAFCTSSMKALRTLKAKVALVVIPQCIGDGNAAQIPSGFEGVKVGGTATLDPADEGFKLFDAVMDTYGGGEERGGTAGGGFQAILGFARAMSGLTGDVTPASVTATLKAMQPQAIPLGVGGKFQCTGTQVALGPNICATTGLLGTADKDGNVTDFQLLEVAEFLKPPAK